MITCRMAGLDKLNNAFTMTIIKLAAQKYMETIASKLQQILVQRITTRGMYFVNVPFEPNADYTVNKKGFDQPYYETGFFQKSIHTKKSGDVWFVGVEGADLEYIAEINEYGGFDRDGSPWYIPPRFLFTDVIENEKVRNEIINNVEMIFDLR